MKFDSLVTGSTVHGVADGLSKNFLFCCMSLINVFALPRRRFIYCHSVCMHNTVSECKVQIASFISQLLVLANYL